ncbi:HAD family phosphatase [uncultured Muribaculum sp.]|uniref:HAD family hydrolase n=1 Tax=uncultured Muribaculum sp. TaxID=1918613 RepID=UPI0026EB85F3|nr:HAD-IA family hydrolase [uncultured Muribaculum sp.]
MISPFHSDIVRFLQRHHYSCVTPRAALIDMDGTLYDSMKNHTAAWHRLMTEAGIPCTRDEFYLYEGRTGASTINTLFNRALGRDATDEEKESLYHKKTVYFNELPPVKPMPGALDMVTTLSQAGIRRVLVTGSGQSSLISRIDTDFLGLFDPDMRITSRDVKHGKPHPEPFIRAMQLARVSPSQSIVIENAPLGIEAGDKAGAFTIGVTTGPIPVEEMEKAGAAIVFPSMEKFAEALPMLLLALLNTRIDS